MNSYQQKIQRAQMLLQQHRMELAEETLRSAIVEEPDEGFTYSLLAVIKSEQKEYAEAQQLAERGLAMSPDAPYSHYALSEALFRRDKFQEADRAIDAAIEMDPTDPGYHAQKAQIAVSQSKWKLAVDSANTGLMFDPEHTACTNLRAVALTKLGRRDEAGIAIESALAANPENAVSHANMGWTKLHAGKPTEAAEHFKEALRLEPSNEWARQGIIEALKARNFFYRQILRYFLWVSRFPPRTLMLMNVGVIVVIQVMVRLPEGSVAATLGVFVALIYMLFAGSTWLAGPVFDLLLRFDRFGRLILTKDEVADTNYLAIALAIVAVLFYGPITTGFRLPDLINYALLMLPVAVTLRTPREAKRKLASAATCIIFLMAMLYAYRWYVDWGIPGLDIGPHEIMNDVPISDRTMVAVMGHADSQMQLLSYFTWGAVLMTWFGDYFRRQTK